MSVAPMSRWTKRVPKKVEKKMFEKKMSYVPKKVEKKNLVHKGLICFPEYLVKCNSNYVNIWHDQSWAALL